MKKWPVITHAIRLMLIISFSPIGGWAQSPSTPPPSMGSIQDSFSAHPNENPKIILIEDASNQYEIQKSISGLLEFCILRFKGQRVPYVIAVEGATGRLYSSFMVDFPDQMSRKQAMDMLLQEGRLSGVEHVAMRYGLLKKIVGVEDPDEYETHEALFQKTFTTHKQLTYQLQIIENQLDLLRNEIYPAHIRQFQNELDTFAKGQQKLESFIPFLIQKARRHKALNAFWGPYKEKPVLVLKKYSKERVIDEVDRLAERIKRSMALVSEPHKEIPRKRKAFSLSKATHQNRSDLQMLLQIEHDLATLVRIANFKASSEELFELKPRTGQWINQLRFLLKAYAPKKGKQIPSPIQLEANECFNATHTALGSLPQLISISLDYYRLALARQKPMATNTIALLKPKKTNQPYPKVALLITNPFHARGVARELRKQHVSYVHYRPNSQKALSKELKPTDILTSMHSKKRKVHLINSVQPIKKQLKPVLRNRGSIGFVSPVTLSLTTTTHPTADIPPELKALETPDDDEIQKEVERLPRIAKNKSVSLKMSSN